MLPALPRVKVDDANLARFFDALYSFAKAVRVLLRPYDDQDEWKSLPLATGWVPFPAAGYDYPQYRMCPDGRTVKVRGAAVGATATVGILPVNYRPKTIHSVSTAGDSTSAVLDVSPAGVITVTAGSGLAYLLLNFDFEVV